jgi:hypothetical protein
LSCAAEDVIEVYDQPVDRNGGWVCLNETTKQLVREIWRSNPRLFSMVSGAVREALVVTRRGLPTLTIPA